MHSDCWQVAAENVAPIARALAAAGAPAATVAVAAPWRQRACQLGAAGPQVQAQLMPLTHLKPSAWPDCRPNRPPRLGPCLCPSPGVAVWHCAPAAGRQGDGRAGGRTVLGMGAPRQPPLLKAS